MVISTTQLDWSAAHRATCAEDPCRHYEPATYRCHRCRRFCYSTAQFEQHYPAACPAA